MKKISFQKSLVELFSLNALKAVLTTLLKCFNLNQKYLLQIAKTFFRIKLLPLKTSFFVGSSGQVESSFDNTAGCFSLKVWEKIWKLKVPKQILPLDTYTAVWRPHKKMFCPTSECPSLNSRQKSKSLTLPERHSALELCLWMRCLQFRKSSQIGCRWLSSFYYFEILK